MASPWPRQVHLIVSWFFKGGSGGGGKGGVSLEGEVPDEAGVRVIRRGRAAVGGRHDGLTAVASVHVSIGLHVVAAQHVGA